MSPWIPLQRSERINFASAAQKYLLSLGKPGFFWSARAADHLSHETQLPPASASWLLRDLQLFGACLPMNRWPVCVHEAAHACANFGVTFKLVPELIARTVMRDRWQAREHTALGRRLNDDAAQ